MGDIDALERTLNATINKEIFNSGAHSTDPSVNGTYLKEMLSSVFCLNIRGRMPECHRFYEMLDCGCIPVFIDFYSSFDYTWQFLGWKGRLEDIEWRKGKKALPFIWTKDAHSFKTIYDSFMNNGSVGLARLDVLQRETMEWWRVAKQHIRNIYHKAICSFVD